MKEQQIKEMDQLKQLIDRETRMLRLVDSQMALLEEAGLSKSAPIRQLICEQREALLKQKRLTSRMRDGDIWKAISI